MTKTFQNFLHVIRESNETFFSSFFYHNLAKNLWIILSRRTKNVKLKESQTMDIFYFGEHDELRKSKNFHTNLIISYHKIKEYQQYIKICRNISKYFIFHFLLFFWNLLYFCRYPSFSKFWKNRVISKYMKIMCFIQVIVISSNYFRNILSFYIKLLFKMIFCLLEL